MNVGTWKVEEQEEEDEDEEEESAFFTVVGGVRSSGVSYESRPLEPLFGLPGRETRSSPPEQ